MKKVLVIGSAGMAGHMICKYFETFKKYELVRVARTDKYGYCDIVLDVQDSAKVLEIVTQNDFDYIINCVGILVQASADDLPRATFVNSVFPNFLAKITKDTKTKVIHLSTDCVFLGDNGPYSETDPHDGVGNYALTKALGEINNSKDLSIRMSIMGPELKDNGSGLMQWFMKQKGTVKGYTKAIWNGVTTLELAIHIDKLLDLDITGVYNLAPKFDITKYDLLLLIQKVYEKDGVDIVPDDEVVFDKTLISKRLNEYNPMIPNYLTQLTELKAFNTK